jgi:hypothetical protein
MATVYKIEIKATSHWTNFPPEQIEKMLTKLIEETTHLDNIEINAERVA